MTTRPTAVPVCGRHGIPMMWETTLVAPHWECRLCMEPSYCCEDECPECSP